MSAEGSSPRAAVPAGQGTLPPRGPLLGLDFGTKRFGVAVCDGGRQFAAPLCVIPRSSAVGDAAALRKVAAEYEPVGLVVGLPVHMSGDEGAKAKQAREWGVWAGRALGLPVVWWDERHTSTVAEGQLLSAGLSDKKRKAMLDAVAARIMLQNYLDAVDRP